MQDNESDSNKNQQQTEQDFEHIGDINAIENRADVAEPTESATPNADEESRQDDTPEPVATAIPTSKHVTKLNKYFLYTLIAGLVVSAIISITAVLLGEFNDTMGRALSTTASMVTHTLFALWLISISNKRGKSPGLIMNTLIGITIASFVTSLLGIWGVISGKIVGDLYVVYTYTIFAVLWLQLLLLVGYNLLDKPTYITTRISGGFTLLFYAILVPTAFIDQPAEFHVRALAAAAIALATSSVLTTVFHRMYLFKHPEARALPEAKRGLDIVVALLILFVGLPIIVVLIGSLAIYSARTNLEKSYTQPEQPVVVSPSVLQPQAETTNCADKPEFATPPVMRYYSTYTYSSNDAANQQITVAYVGAPIAPINYTGTLKVVDAHCQPLDNTALHTGDKVQFYLRVGYTNFYKDALALVQKVE